MAGHSSSEQSPSGNWNFIEANYNWKYYFAGLNYRASIERQKWNYNEFLKLLKKSGPDSETTNEAIFHGSVKY